MVFDGQEEIYSQELQRLKADEIGFVNKYCKLTKEIEDELDNLPSLFNEKTKDD